MEKDGLPPEKKALIVNLIMGLRAIFHEPDDVRAKESAAKLVDEIDRLDRED